MVSVSEDVEALRLQVAALNADVAAIGDQGWLLYCTALVLFMQCGFALVEAGTCRSQNVLSIMMKNQADCIISILTWFIVGRAFAYGDSSATGGWVGTSGFFQSELFRDEALQIDVAANFHFNSAFCSVATTIVSGGIAERTQLSGYMVFSSIMSSLLYPAVVCWCWNTSGWIKTQGFYDFAGTCVVHLTGGIGALCGAVVVGPRQGRFSWRDDKYFAPHSVPFIQLGTMILWFGWYGFNAGSVGRFSKTEDAAVALLASINTTLGAASGGCCTLFLQVICRKKYSIPTVCNGMLVGLVSITGCCSVVSPWSAIAIAATGGLLYILSARILETLHVDDPVGAFPVHGVGGFWGILAVPLFHRGRDAGGESVEVPAFETQVIGAVMVVGFVGVVSAIVFKLIVTLGFGKVSAYGQSCGDEPRYETMAYGGNDLERYSAFICHAKDGRGAFARWLQLELSRFSSRNKIFLDSDNLVNLGALLGTVREKVDVLLLLVSDEVWHRPWCAGEVSSAYIANATVVLVCLDDFPFERSSTYFLQRRDEVQETFSQRDLEMLSTYGITREHIQHAYESLQDSRKIHFPINSYETGVDQVAQAALLRESRRVTSGSCMNPKGTVKEPKVVVNSPRKQYSTLLILGNTEDVEAVAAMHICRHGLVEAGCGDGGVQILCVADMPDHEEVLQCVSRGAGVLLLLSKGVLQCHIAQQVFLLVRARTDPANSKLHRHQQVPNLEQLIVLLHADRLGFEFPSQDFRIEFQEEDAESSSGLRRFNSHFPYVSVAERSDALAEFLQALFKQIALPLSTHGSWHSLQHQFSLVSERMQAVDFVTHHLGVSPHLSLSSSLLTRVKSIGTGGDRTPRSSQKGEKVATSFGSEAEEISVVSVGAAVDDRPKKATLSL